MNNRVIPSEVEGSPSAQSGGDPSTDARDDTNWRRLYAIVLIWLAVQILIFYAFTKAFQ